MIFQVDATLKSNMLNVPSECLDGEMVEHSSGFSESTDQNSEIIYRRNRLLDIRS